MVNLLCGPHQDSTNTEVQEALPHPHERTEQALNMVSAVNFSPEDLYQVAKSVAKIKAE